MSQTRSSSLTDLVPGSFGAIPRRTCAEIPVIDIRPTLFRCGVRKTLTQKPFRSWQTLLLNGLMQPVVIVKYPKCMVALSEAMVRNTNFTNWWQESAMESIKLLRKEISLPLSGNP